jgi:hypothetical protein
VLAVQLALSLVLSTTVLASNFGSQGTPGTGGLTNGVWLTLDTTWSVTRVQLTTTYYNGVTSAIQTQCSPTELFVLLYTTTYCFDADHDLCLYDSNYGNNGVNGWNACAGSVIGQHPNQKCSVDWVRINLYYSPPAQRIACHEMGHAVGLRHTSDQASCMKQTSEGGTSQVLTQHDKDHLNGQY